MSEPIADVKREVVELALQLDPKSEATKRKHNDIYAWLAARNLAPEMPPGGLCDCTIDERVAWEKGMREMSRGAAADTYRHFVLYMREILETECLYNLDDT